VLEISWNKHFCLDVYLSGFFALQGAGGDGTDGREDSNTESFVNSGDGGNIFDEKRSDNQDKKKRKRCAVCRKKVGLTGECHICHHFLLLTTLLLLILCDCAYDYLLFISFPFLVLQSAVQQGAVTS
jgi:hypothetical protein